MENGKNKEETQAVSMDGWISWDVKEGMAREPD
jgi:hypothetical protein